MVIDSSAIIAILSNEPEAIQFAQAIQTDNVRLLSAATFLEAAIVIEARYGLPGGDKLDEFISAAQIRIESVTPNQASTARLAYRTYGKGRHPAALNYGDCFAYALAIQSDEPLLFKGDDFGQTNVKTVV